MFHCRCQIALQLPHEFLLACCEVTLLSRITLEVVEFWLAARIILNQLPLTRSHRLLPPILPVQVLMGPLLLPSQGVDERNAIDGRAHHCSSQLAGSWKEIPERKGLRAGCSGLHHPGPPCDGGNPNTSLIEIPLESSQGAIGVEDLVLMSSFGMRPIVGSENHQSPVINFQLTEKIEKTADIPIHPCYHRRLPLACIFPVAFLIGPVVGHLHSITIHSAAFIIRMRNCPMNVQEKRLILTTPYKRKGLLSHDWVRPGDFLGCHPSPRARVLGNNVTSKGKFVLI